MFSGTSHRLLLAAVGLLIFAQVVALLPSRTSREVPGYEDARTPVTSLQNSRFKGFDAPQGLTPDYSIRNFRYVSVQHAKKQWQLTATEALFFSSQETVLTSDVHAELFSDHAPQSASLRVTGKAARYSVSTRELEVGGTVVAQFPDGSEIHTEFLKFDPRSSQVIVPSAYSAFGRGPKTPGAQVQFQSQGLEGTIDSGKFQLPAQVEIRVFSKPGDSHPSVFQAARAELATQEGLFRLFSGKPQSKQEFVTLRQQGSTELFARARTMEIRTSPENPSKKPSFTALDDVRIEEWNHPRSSRADQPFRYSTSGRAEFHPDTLEFTLTEFPQVYQNEDTMTGELIRVDRKNDRVEVENTNAISKGDYE
jgi:LPS export ABC transporter protein LptC